MAEFYNLELDPDAVKDFTPKPRHFFWQHEYIHAESGAVVPSDGYPLQSFEYWECACGKGKFYPVPDNSII